MLRQKLNALFEMTTGRQGQPPTPTDVVIAEIEAQGFDAQGRARIARSDLRTPDEYDVRFEALLSKGYPWVNLSFYGFIGERALVVVELPAVEPQPPSTSTSVNLSGPPAAAAASGWDARLQVVFI